MNGIVVNESHCIRGTIKRFEKFRMNLIRISRPKLVDTKPVPLYEGLSKAKMFVLSVTNNGIVWYMRTTTWSSQLNRATTFETKEAANAHFEKSKKFVAKALHKNVQIIDIGLGN